MPSAPNDVPQGKSVSQEPVRMLDSDGIEKLISVLTDQVLHEYRIYENIPFILVGIHRNGVPLANRIAREIAKRTGKEPQKGTLDITM